MFKKIKDFTSSGFSSNINNEGERLITKNGKFNVKKEGLSFLQRFNLFHYLINMSSLSFFLCLLIGFSIVNLFFTSLYLLVGLEGLQGVNNGGFFDAFFFSAQTLTTVGYGGLHPVGKTISLIASFEAFIGLLSFAVSTGLLYGRFSKPKPKLMFSDKALISPYNDITGLMARIANPKDSQLINVEAKVMYSQIEMNENSRSRKFYTLDLEMNQISLFATSWTIVHPINEDSPLFNLSYKDLEERNAEMILILSAYDETYNQDVHARTSYKFQEIVLNAKFTPILGHNTDQQSVIQLDRLNEYEITQ